MFFIKAYRKTQSVLRSHFHIVFKAQDGAIGCSERKEIVKEIIEVNLTAKSVMINTPYFYTS